MAWITPLRAIVFAAALIVSPASAETLRMGGVGASAAMLPPLFAAFDRNREHRLEVVPALGSSGGLRAAADGVLDIAVAGRGLKADETTQGLTQALAGIAQLLAQQHSEERAVA